MVSGEFLSPRGSRVFLQVLTKERDFAAPRERWSSHMVTSVMMRCTQLVKSTERQV